MKPYKRFMSLLFLRALAKRPLSLSLLLLLSSSLCLFPSSLAKSTTASSNFRPFNHNNDAAQHVVAVENIHPKNDKIVQQSSEFHLRASSTSSASQHQHHQPQPQQQGQISQFYQESAPSKSDTTTTTTSTTASSSTTTVSEESLSDPSNYSITAANEAAANAAAAAAHVKFTPEKKAASATEDGNGSSSSSSSSTTAEASGVISETETILENVKETTASMKKGTTTSAADTNTSSSRTFSFSSKPKHVSAAATATAPVAQAEASDYADGVFGIQIAGPMNAGGMIYDETSETVYFSGATYRDFKTNKVSSTKMAQCFIGELQPLVGTTSFQIISSGDAVSEVCTTIAASPTLGSLFVLGTSEMGKEGGGGGLFTDTDKSWMDGIDVSNFGFAAQVGLAGHSTRSVDLVSGSLLKDEAAVSPVAVVTTENDKYITVASMGARIGGKTADFHAAEKDPYPDLTLGGYRKYGSKFHLKLTKLKVLTLEEALTATLPLEMVTEHDAKYYNDEFTSVYVGGMVAVENNFVIAGSTWGSGGVFGDDTVKSMSGFIVKIDPESGVSSSTRITSRNGFNTHIRQVCADPNDSTKLYVVGNTREDGPDQAPFVASIDYDTLDMNWKGILDVVNPRPEIVKGFAEATGCAVKDGKLYISGVAKDGVKVETETSKGGDDVFVASVNTDTGALNWIRQIGSEKNERLAEGGGIAIGPNGSVILYGQTRGNLYRTRTAPETGGEGWENWNEIFIISLSSSGNADAPLSTVLTPLGGVDGADPPHPMARTPQEKEEEALRKFRPEIIALIVLASAFGLLLLCWLFVRFQRKRKIQKSQQRMNNVFKYLRKVDSENIDVRRSPAGGFHGEYINNLANGEDDDMSSLGSKGSRKSLRSKGSKGSKGSKKSSPGGSLSGKL